MLRYTPLLCLLALFASAMVWDYVRASNTAATWRSADSSFQDQWASDTDGLSDGDVQQIVRDQESGSANLERWPVTGGLLSLAVLDYRLQRLEWWRAYAFSARMAATAPGSTVSSRAQDIHDDLLQAVACGATAMVCLLGLVWEWRRTQRPGTVSGAV